MSTAIKRIINGNNLNRLTHIVNRRYSDSQQFSEKSFNQVTLLGRVGMDPQLRGSDINPVLVFTLATNTNYRNDEAFKQKTEWHRISVFKPYLRDTLNTYLRKGSRVFVQGRLMYGEITDTKGVTHQTTTIAADEVIFVGTPTNNEDNTLQ